MSFESEVIHSFLENESEYTEDLRERHATAQVFESARDRQRELSELRIPKGEVLNEWNGAQELLRKLDQQANDEGVLGLPVSLRGENLEVPKFQGNLATGLALLSFREVGELTAENIETYYESHDVKGYFGGFTMQFAQEDEDTFVPRLSYQVAIGAHDMPNSHINLYATGAVGDAQLSFVADEKMDTVAPLVEELYELAGNRLSNLSRLNMILASNDKYDAEMMRRIAFDAGKVVKAANKEVAQQVEDKLIDLISEYITPGTSLSVGMRNFFIIDTEDDTKKMYYNIAEGEEAMRATAPCNGLVFLHQPIVEDGVVKGYQGNRTLYATMAGETQIAYIPLTRVEEFQNL